MRIRNNNRFPKGVKKLTKAKLKFLGNHVTKRKNAGEKIYYALGHKVQFKIRYFPKRIEAWGEVEGKKFYFLSQNGRWSFKLDHEGAFEHPVEVETDTGFYREGIVKGKTTLAKTVVQKIIEDCSREYLQEYPPDLDEYEDWDHYTYYGKK